MAPSSGGMLVQSRFGLAIGNLEVVVPVAASGLAHVTRFYDTWTEPVWFGVGFFSSAALIHSTFDLGNLEVVARQGTRLVHYGRGYRSDPQWKGPFPVGGGVRGEPGFIEGSWGEPLKNYEVVAPLANGGLGHWWRDNNAAGYPWRGPTPFGAGTGTYDAAALIQSSYGGLEVVARRGSELVHFWRGANGIWRGPTLFAQGVAGTPAFIEGTAGRDSQPAGNFEVVAPLAAGGMGHWWRRNTADQSWFGPTPFGGGGAVTAVGLTEVRPASPPLLEVVARRAGRLEHWRRDPFTFAWQGPTVFFTEPQPCHGATLGQCRIQLDSGVVAIHAALMHTGKVLVFGFADFDQDVGVSRTLDPVTGALRTPALGGHNPFCAGLCHLPDGRLLVAGGHGGDHLRSVHTFDPETLAWHQVARMESGRWYPTCITLPNGKVFVISGTQSIGEPDPPNILVNNTFQLFDPATGKLGPPRAVPKPFAKVDVFETVDLYPFCYVLPSGQVLVHSRRTTRFVNPATGVWEDRQLQTNHDFSRNYPGEGASVLLPLSFRDNYRARVLVAGGGGANPKILTRETPATDTAEILDLGVPAPAWRAVAPMRSPRVLNDAVLLPDGTVAVMGGSRTGRADVAAQPVFEVEIFDPTTETWAARCPMRVPRLYHSTALLLPDARVMMAGKDGIFQLAPYKYPEHRVEFFYPPYLFRGPRPAIEWAPAYSEYDRPMEIGTPNPAAITSVVLIRTGAVTHGFNMDQRLVELRITGRAADTVTVQAPPNARIAPPGYYLLFILASGVPSVAAFVLMGPVRSET